MYKAALSLMLVSGVSQADSMYVPYYNTYGNMSTRFQLVNTSNYNVPIQLLFRNVQGQVVGTVQGTLTANDMVATGIVPVEGGSRWFVGSGDLSALSDTSFGAKEGYVEIKVEPFATPGPADPGWNPIASVRDLMVDFSYWQGSSMIKDISNSVYNQSIKAIWTINQNRSTDVVVTKPGVFQGGCQSVSYTISDRDGKTIGASGPVFSPSSGEVKTLCNDVTVFSFGSGIFQSEVQQSMNNDLAWLNQLYNIEVVGGWFKLNTEGYNLYVRSNW